MHRNHSEHNVQDGRSAPLASGNMVVPALLAALATLRSSPDSSQRRQSRVARKDSCTVLRTHGFRAVSQSAPPAICACGRRKDCTMAEPVSARQQHGRTGVSQLNTMHPRPSALSSSMRASHPKDERRLPPNRQVERAASYVRHGCLHVHPM